MGWTIYDRSTSPRTRAEERAEIVRLHTDLVPEAPYDPRCLMASKVGTTWYVAIRVAPRPGAAIPAPVLPGYVPGEDGAVTYAGVVLTSRRDGEWGYKAMCEDMGPVQAEAPRRLLSLLSTLDPEADRHAQARRDRVEAHHAARRGRPRIAPGDRFEVAVPFTFGMPGGSPFAARRFEAFRAERPGRRARALFRTLDTDAPRVVAIAADTLKRAGATRIE